MGNSYSELIDSRCGKCDHAYQVEVWLIVDMTEQPELLESIRAGTIHSFPCPNCGYMSNMDVPLLFYCPGAEPTLFYSPAQHITQERDQQLAFRLVHLLKRRLGDAWQEEWLTLGLPIMPREVVVTILSVRHLLGQEIGTGSGSEQFYLAAKVLSGLPVQEQRDLAHLIANSQRGDHLLEAPIDHRHLKDALNTALRHAQVVTNVGPPVLSARLTNAFKYADEAADKYLQTNDPDALERALSLFESILSHAGFASAPVSFQVATLSSFGSLLIRTYNQLARFQDLDKGVELLRRALQLAPDTLPDRDVYLGRLALGLNNRYLVTGEMIDLHQAIDLSRQSVELTTPDSPNWAMYLTNLGNALRDRYAHANDPDDLEQALLALSQAVEVTPPNASQRATRLTNLSLGLCDRYRHFKNSSDLAKAIACAEEAVTLAQTSPTRLIFSLDVLSNCLRERYRLAQDLSDLEKAIALASDAVQLSRLNPARRPSCLLHLGLGLLARHDKTHEWADLKLAIQSLKQALELTPHTSPDWPGILLNLCFALLTRQEHDSPEIGFDDEAAVLEQALRLIPDRETPVRLQILSRLAIGLEEKYEQTEELAELRKAEVLCQQIIRLEPSIPQFQTAHLILLGKIALHEYQEGGESTAADKAVKCFQQALDGIVSNSHLEDLAAGGLADAMRTRYGVTGNLDELNQSIVLLRAILMRKRHSPPNEQRVILVGLGGNLIDHYRSTGDLSELEEGLELLQRALQIKADDSASLRNLGNGFHYQYGRFKNRADLENAISLWQRALEHIPASSMQRAGVISSLGAGFAELYSLTGNQELLEQAVLHAKQAIELTPSTMPARVNRLNFLGAILRRYAKVTGQLTHLDVSIQALQEAIDNTSPSQRIRISVLHNLAKCLQERYSVNGEQDDLKQAKVAYSESCTKGLAAQPEASLVSSQAWGDWALSRGAWEEAAEALNYGSQAIEQILRAQLLRARKEVWLRDAQGLTVNAGYALAKIEDLTNAVVTLDVGRARLLAEAQERDRHDLKHLNDIGHSVLYQRYRTAADHIAQLESTEVRPQEQPSSSDLVVKQRTARAELDAIISEIQLVPGYEDFFSTPTFERIQRDLLPTVDVTKAAAYLLVTSVGGLALVLHGSDVQLVWLDLIEADVNGWLLKRDGESVVGGYLPAQFGEVPLESALAEVLPVLGEKVMYPVAEALKSLGVSDVTLIPCGRLALLPLHASEYRVDGVTRCFMDELTVTYAPSARALGSSREALNTRSDRLPSLLGVGNPLPLPERAKPLVFARPEVEEIAQLFDGQAMALYEEDATHTAVEAQLGATTYLHLSCHGMFNLSEPLESGVVLSYGEMITLRDLLARQRLSGTRLVVLSACQTAITDFKDLPEEAIGLPAGFLQAGVPGVVGTLWPVNDLSTALLMIKFYEYHLKGDASTGVGPMQPAAALREAQLWLRDVTNAELSELFEKYKMTAPDRPERSRMAFELASERFREHTLRDPDERPFAHPYYWAPFVFYGV